MVLISSSPPLPCAVAFRHGERIGFSYLVSQRFCGERVRLSVLRDGKPREVGMELKAHKKLVPVHTGGRNPSYYIVAGLVFTNVTLPYLKAEVLLPLSFNNRVHRLRLNRGSPVQFGKEYDLAPRLLDKLMHGQVQVEEEEVVVLSQVLVADVNIGYEDTQNHPLIKCNGTEVRNLRQLVRLVEGCRDQYLRFELDLNQVRTRGGEEGEEGEVEDGVFMFFKC